MLVPFLIDLFFPAQCVNCHREGRLLCTLCRLKLTPASLACPYCNTGTVNGMVCDSCKRKGVAANGCISLYDYADPVTKKIIAALKYKELHDVRTCIIPDIEERLSLLSDCEILVPVPQTAQSLQSRGYNQSELFAQTISKVSNIPLSDQLRVRGNNKAQHNKNQKDRWKDMEHAISAARLAKGVTRAIVVDDVLTTGATLEACARALKSQGVREVWGLTIARQNKLT